MLQCQFMKVTSIIEEYTEEYTDEYTDEYTAVCSSFATGNYVATTAGGDIATIILIKRTKKGGSSLF